MFPAARAGWWTRALIAMTLMLAAPHAHAQGAGGFGMALATVGLGKTSPFPADWQRTNTLANMSIFNSMGSTVTANIQVTLSRDGVIVGTTPAVARTYPNGTTIYPTAQVTDWRTLKFSGKVGDALDESGHLPDGSYEVCVDITNIRSVTGQTAPDVPQCLPILALFPKPPSLQFPVNGSVVSVPNPVFQWTPVVSRLGQVLTYWFRMVEILPGQTALQAIEANRSIYENLFSSVNTFPYPASAPFLLEGRVYAWRIQALYPVSSGSGGGGLSNNNLKSRGGAAGTTAVTPIGENEGRSKVFTFAWTADPRRAAEVQSRASGSVGTPDLRVGSAWPDGSPNDSPTDSPTDPSNSAHLRQGGAGLTGGGTDGSQENFADRMARLMASVWKRGPGAAVATARAGRAVLGDAGASAGASPSSPSSPSSSGRSEWREAVDARIAQGPTGSGGATDSEGVAPPPPDSAAPDSTTSGVTDAAPPEAQPQSPGNAGGESPPSSISTPAMEPSGLGPNWARLHGTASLTGEAYSRDGSGSPTRPDRSGRVVTGLSVGILKDRVRVPVSALVSDDQVSFRQNINQVAVAPRWQWAGLMAGNFSPQYSPYTLADASILGAGVDLAPKRWRVGFVSGQARKAIVPTLAAIVTPQFQRNVTAGRIGYGDPQSNTVEFAVMRATDDANSIAGAESTLTITPEGNTVYSMKLQGVLPKRHLRAQFETALSRLDRDRRADAPTVDGRAIGLQLSHETSLARLGVKAEYLNGGFTTLGNSGITGDRVDVGLNARVQMFQGKLALDGTAGLRNDAISTALAAETRRRNYGVNGSWQPGPKFGADAQISVYTNESDGIDTLLTGSTSDTRVYSVMPHAAWSVRGVQNSLSCSAMLQKSENGGSGTFLSTNSLSLLGSWSAVISRPWTVTLSGNYTKTDFKVGVMETSAFGPGFTWSAFKSKVLTTAQLQLTQSRTGNNGIDKELTPRMEMRWEFAPRQALVARGNFRRFHYATPGTPEFDERVASLEYVTNL
jgi:hypothetical protein